MAVMAEEARENISDFPYRVASPEFFFLLQRIDRLDEKLSGEIKALDSKLSDKIEKLEQNMSSAITTVMWTGVLCFAALILTLILAATKVLWA